MLNRAYNYSRKIFTWTIGAIMKLFNRMYKPTPLFWRLVGDAILVGFGGTSLDKIFANERHAAIACVVVAIVGKMLTNIPVDNKKD